MSRVVPLPLVAALSIVTMVGCGRIGFDWLPSTGAEQDASFADQDATIFDASFAELDAAPLDISDPPSLAGIWSLQGLTYLVDGAPVDVPRASGGVGVLGEFELISTGPTSFSFSAGTVMIDNNLPVDYNNVDGTMIVESDGRWLMNIDNGDVIVVDVTLDDEEQLALIWDKDDPRNDVSFTAPEATVMKRNFSHTASAAGDWNSLAIEYRGGNVYTPGGCVMLSAGEYQMIDMDWHFDSLLRTVINVNSSRYTDSNCQNQTSQDLEVFEGLGQEEGTRQQFWGGESSFGPVYVDAQVSFQGENLRILVTDCSPKPACESLSEDHLFEPAP